MMKVPLLAHKMKNQPKTPIKLIKTENAWYFEASRHAAMY
jgi:hypothetical protein